MLESLNAEQESLLDKVSNEYLRQLNCQGGDPLDPNNLTKITTWLQVVYRDLYNIEAVPEIIVCDSPDAALKLASDLTGEKQITMDRMGISDAGWVSFYDYFSRIGVIDAEESREVFLLAEYQRLIWGSVLLDEKAILIRYPDAISLDADGQLNGQLGPALRWRDGTVEWFWHGASVTERLVMTPLDYSAAEYRAISSTEYRRALSESMGWAYVAKLLGATVKDAWIDPETGLLYALLSAGDQRWLRKQSPVTSNGSQPTYIEPVHEDLRTAQAARKWQALSSISVAECERDPELNYGIET